MDYYKKMTDKYRATFGDDFEPKQFKHKNAEYWQYVKDLYFGWYGAYEIYKETTKTATWYSYFGSEGFVKVHMNFQSGKQTRTLMKWKWNHIPKHLLTADGCTKYNYFCG